MSKKLRPPKGVYETVDDWKRFSKNGKEDYQKFNFPDVSSYKNPKGIEENIHWKFIEQMTKYPPSAYVALLNQARVCGKNGSIITSDNKLLYEASFEYGTQPKSHPIFRMSKLPNVKYEKGRILDATFCASEYYYHWMFDVLPRFYLLEQSKWNYDKIIVTRKNQLSFQNETLHVLGVDFNRLIECSEDLHIEARELIIPASAGYTGHMPKWACEFLRNKFLKPHDSMRNKRLFISRQNAGYRKLINENEIMGILEKYGFEKIVLETKSVAEQVKIFSSAEAVVSPHGGGLTNLVFCQAGTKVIEFFSPTYVNVLYWILANHVELDYYYVIGEGARPEAYIDPHHVWEDITVREEHVKKVLDLANL